MQVMPSGLAIVVGLIGLFGCDTNQNIIISGKVALNGQPIQDGVIKFCSMDGSGPTAAAKIRAGNYELEIKQIGEKVVAIEGYEEAAPQQRNQEGYPGTPPGGLKHMKSIVPAKFNVTSKLRYMVQESAQDVDFDLKDDL